MVHVPMGGGRYKGEIVEVRAKPDPKTTIIRRKRTKEFTFHLSSSITTKY